MLAIPLVVGMVLRAEESALAWHLIPLSGCWVIGYLAFNATTLWLKTPRARRSAPLAPALTYSALAVALGLVTVWMAGPAILGWVPVFAALIGATLWLATRRRERTVLSGGLTVAAASLMTLVVRFDSPQELLSVVGTPPAESALLYTALVFGYLFGTVLYVKTMIRERGRPGWVTASVCWHVSWLAFSVWFAASGRLEWGWAVFFAATVVRSWLLPRLARTRRIRPLAIGLLEITFTAGLLWVAS